MIGDALSFPTTADDWIQTVVIGGVLSLLGFLVLPGIVVQGYLVRVTRAGATGAGAPSFTDWGELLVDGVKLFALTLAASVVVVVPLAVVVGFGGAAAGMTGSRALVGVVGLGVLLVAGVAVLALGYLLPAAIANFAMADSLAAAFDAGTVLDGALTGEYASAWLAAVLIGLVGGMIGGMLTALLVGVFLVFYVQVVVYYLFGRGFAAGLGVAPEDGTPTTGAGPRRRDAGAAVDRETDATGRTTVDAAGSETDAPESVGSGAGAGVDDPAADTGSGPGSGTDTDAEPSTDAEAETADDGTDADPRDRESDASGDR